MKNKYIKFISYSFVLISILLLSGCFGSKTQTEIFNDFLESKTFNIQIGTEFEEETTSLLSVVSATNGMYIQSESTLDEVFPFKISIDYKEKDFYFQSGLFSMYSDVEEELKELFEKMEDEEPIDLDDYLTNFVEGEEYLTFEINLNKIFGEIDSELGQMLPEFELKNIEGKCYFEKKKVSKIEFEIEEIKFILNVQSYNTLDKIEFPDTKFFIKNDFETIINTLLQQFLPSQEPEVDYSSYELILDEQYYVINVGETLTINPSGILSKALGNDTGYIQLLPEHFDTTNLVHKFYEPGEYSVDIRAFYKGYSFKRTVYINVIQEIETETYDLDRIEKVNYVFEVGEDLFICDDKSIHKYDFINNKIIKSLNLRCAGNNHYLKDGYLYVTANYPYESEYLEEHKYSGTITKIKLDDFTIEKQVTVNFYPYSIIVDNRDKVIVSLGLNQHVNIYEVDLNDGSKKQITMGYQKDVLFYDPYKDILYKTSTCTSEATFCYKYDSDSDSYIITEENEFDFSYFVKKKDNLLITNHSCVFYNLEENSYEIKDLIINEHLDNQFNINEYYNEYVYVFYRGYITGFHSFLKYDFNNNEYENFYFEDEGNNHVYSLGYNNKLYLFNANGSVIILNIN